MPLGISLAELFNEENEIMYPSAKERLLIENFRRLPEGKADLLLNLSNILQK